jgi:CBS domain-containing protein
VSPSPEQTDRTDPPVADLMTTRLVGITPDAPLSEVLHLMAGTGVRHLPVMDGARCTGLVVEVDVVRCVAQGGPLATAWSVHAGEIARPVERVASTATRSDVARAMRAAGSDAVLVVDDGRVRGIVTATDLVRSLTGAPDGGP